MTHLEDEPVEVVPATASIRDSRSTRFSSVVEITRELIRYQVDGRERTLARALAGNVTVEPVADPARSIPA